MGHDCIAGPQGVADRLNADWEDGPALVEVYLCPNGCFRMVGRTKIVPGSRDLQTDRDNRRWYDVGGSAPAYTAASIKADFPDARDDCPEDAPSDSPPQP